MGQSGEIWTGKGWGEKVNVTYIKGKCGLLFENDNVSGIYYGWGDWGLGRGKVLWISGEGVGICYGLGLWKSGGRCLIYKKEGNVWFLEV